MRLYLFVALGLLFAWFVVYWFRALSRNHEWRISTPFQYLVGFFTNFLDTLGIGSFAITTAIYRWRRTIDDAEIPGTLNVGHALPIATQAFIYIAMVEVEFWTLIATIAASVLGAWLGAGVVTHLPKRKIQIGMGTALIAAAALMTLKNFNLLPSGGDAIELNGVYFTLALVGNFIFGALMTIGVGAYAPIMIMVSLLGMNPKAAFPIMMGSCAFLMPVAGYRFIRAKAYNSRAALGLTIGGIPAVIIAAFIVKELPLEVVRSLVIFVVLYAALGMLWSAHKHRS